MADTMQNERLPHAQQYSSSSKQQYKLEQQNQRDELH